MRKSKLNKSNKNKLRKENKAEKQRKRKEHKRAVMAYDGRLGELVGDTYREKNAHLNVLLDAERIKLKKEAEAKAKAEAEKESKDD